MAIRHSVLYRELSKDGIKQRKTFLVIALAVLGIFATVVYFNNPFYIGDEGSLRSGVGVFCLGIALQAGAMATFFFTELEGDSQARYGISILPFGLVQVHYFACLAMAAGVLSVFLAFQLAEELLWALVALFVNILFGFYIYRIQKK